jgi:peptidoglycan/xylan/chitin deacetylase (PgdA/CDA1 family)
MIKDTGLDFASGAPPLSAKRRLQQSLRRWHQNLFDRGLPRKVGVYFHGIEAEHHDAFGNAMLCLRGLGYRIATDIYDYLSDPDERTAWISFDDNYASWYEARSLFDVLDIRATFYTSTSVFRDRTMSETRKAFFRRIEYPGEPRSMTTEEMKALRADGHTIGAHTHTHPILSQITLASAKAEIRTSQELLQDILGERIRHFAYPYGLRRHFDDRLIEYCREIGIETVARAIPAMHHAPEQPYELHRSGWRFDQDAYQNIRNLAVAGHWFERITGRSAVG